MTLPSSRNRLRPVPAVPPSQAMRCALVALVGVPNVGKSTLLNAIVGESVGIISPKANTTRLVVRGILSQDEVQMVWLDTPGLAKENQSFNRQLVQQAEGALAEADIVVVLAEATAKGLAQGQTIAQRVRPGQALVLALTKTDKVSPKAKLLPLMEKVQQWARVPQAVVPLAATKGQGTEQLIAEVAKLAPAGPWLFPPEQRTDAPLPLRLAELTRAQAMRVLHQEVPYGLAVRPVSLDDEADGALLVRQDVLVAREGHKPLVLGAGGQMLQRFGRAARLEMQQLLGRGVRLELRVVVEPDWQHRPEILKELGL